jgi:hypothetical protein
MCTTIRLGEKRINFCVEYKSKEYACLTQENNLQLSKNTYWFQITMLIMCNCYDEYGYLDNW